LVPVTATTSSACVGSPNQRAASAPAAPFSAGRVAMRSSSKPKGSTARASTRQATAPAPSASPTNWRASKA
jgi:hypothetical protein